MFSILIISVGLLPLFQYLLLPVVAAILINVAVKMLEVRELVHLWKTDKRNFGVMIAVIIIAIAKDPTYGLMAGILLSVLIFAHHNSKAFAEIESRTAKERKRVTAQDYDNELYFRAPFMNNTTLPFIKTETLATNTPPLPIHDEDNPMDPMDILTKGNILIYKVPSELTFLNGTAHAARTSKIDRDYRAVIIDLRFVYFIDIDGCDALFEMIKEFKRTTNVVVVSGINHMVKPMLSRCHFFHDLEQEEKIFEDMDHALDNVDNIVIKEIDELVRKRKHEEETSKSTTLDLKMPSDVEEIVVNNSQ